MENRILQGREFIKSNISKLYKANIGESNFQKVAQVGEIRTHKDGTKWRKVGVDDWVEVRNEKNLNNKQDDKNSKNKKSLDSKNSKTSLDEYAKETSKEKLKDVLHNSHNSDLVNAARKELNRRKTGGDDGNENGKKKVKELTSEQVKQNEANQWLDRYKDLKLNALPVNIPEEDVTVNLSGDIDSHAVMTWRDPKSKELKHAYTPEFLRRNAEVKWKRVEAIPEKQIKSIRKESTQSLKGAEINEINDAKAIIGIIAHTGLRRGEKNQFQKTGNRGVSTLAPENIEIKDGKAILNFTGKSYKHNIAEITDKNLVDYLSRIKEERGKGKFLFNTSDARVDDVFKKVGGVGLKVKDMRTYVACEVAKDVLFKDSSDPPPLDKSLSQNKQKKLVQDKLKKCFEIVSSRLNNTPTMAKTSYIHPKIIQEFIDNLGVNFEVKKSGVEEMLGLLNDSKKERIDGKINIDSQDEENCDVYNLPDWWDEYLEDEN